MLVRITHATDYHYDAPVYYALQRLMLTPKSDAAQAVREWHVEIEGGSVECAFTDHFDNHVQLLNTHANATALKIVASGSVETLTGSGVAGAHTGFAPLWLFRRDTDLTRSSKSIRDFARAVEGHEPLEKLHALMTAIAAAVKYEIGSTHTGTTAEEALDAGHGVCQDHTHIFLSAARYLGFPCRYVSGYLLMEHTTDQVATHAWAEAHVDPLGWVGFDAANGISPDERYVRMATGLDYYQAAPVSGIRLGNASETLAVSISVEQ